MTRPVTIRKVHRTFHTSRWEIRFHGTLRGVFRTGADAFACLDSMTQAERRMQAVAQHNTPEDPT